MFQQTYYVDKQTGTLADVCAAYGLAVILDGILERALGTQAKRAVRIVDRGTAYAIELTQPLEEVWVDKCWFFAPIPLISTGKNKAKIPKGIVHIDYAKEKARYDQYRRLQRTLGRTMDADTGGESDAEAALKEAKPAPEYPVWQKVNMMSALNTYNDAVMNWYENRTQFAKLLKLLLKIYGTTPNAVGEGESEWRAGLKKSGAQGKTRAAKAKKGRAIFVGKTKLNLLQVWNPSTGKGQNTPKSNRLAMENIDNFWLCEYLKMVGFYHCAVPRYVLVRQAGGKPPKDRKTFALAPVNIALSAHRAIFEIFRDSLRSSSAIKLDILASLNYTDCFLQYCEAAARDDLAVELFGNAPESSVAGLHTAFYKDLGNASAVMNLSFINLPHWMRVADANDVCTYRNVLDEHISIIRGLRQNRRDPASEGGEELTLLSCYRDFLSANDVAAFFDFTAHYAGYLMSGIEGERFWVKPLSQFNLEVLLMNSEPKLKPIIENEGFQSIARAIRQSTVTLQYLARRGRRLYDIRYGLGQELKRRANYAHEFIIALSDFIQSFNAENARVAEISQSQPWRCSVREDHLAEVVHLIDEYGAPLIAHMLLAFGYASSSKDEEAPKTGATTQPTVGGDA